MVKKDSYMEHQKNKWMLDDMLGCYFLVKFGLVSFGCRFYREKYFQFINYIFLLKAFTFTSFERFLCWRSKLLPALFSRNFLKSWIVNYWGSIFTLYLKWGAFSLVCVLSVFFFSSFFLLFFPFSIGIFRDRH